jgi:hypothetical protein
VDKRWLNNRSFFFFFLFLFDCVRILHRGSFQQMRGKRCKFYFRDYSGEDGFINAVGSIIPWPSNSDERTFLGICHSKKKKLVAHRSDTNV